MAELLETVMTAVFDIALLFLVIYSANGRAANSGTRLVAVSPLGGRCPTALERRCL